MTNIYGDEHPVSPSIRVLLTSARVDWSDSSWTDTLLPLRVIAAEGVVTTTGALPASNGTTLVVPDPADSNQYIDVGGAFYCVQPKLSAADKAAGVDPTLLAYDVTADEAAAEVSRRRSDLSYKWQDMFTCAWVTPGALAHTRCTVNDGSVEYENIPPIAHTALGPSDPQSPLHYVNKENCPIDLIGFAAPIVSEATPECTRAHVSIAHAESICLRKYPVFDPPCPGADMFTMQRRNPDGTARSFWTFAGNVRKHYWTAQAYARYVQQHALSPAQAAADVALQDELRPFYDRFVFPPLDTVHTFAAWSKRKSAMAVIISKFYDGRAAALNGIRKHYPVDNLGRFNRTHDTLLRCEAQVLPGGYPVNGDPSVTLAGHSPVRRRDGTKASPLNTTSYSSNFFLAKDSAARCAFQGYKFVLVFENGIDVDYVTEKVSNALLSGSIPVMISSPDIDDFTPDLECVDANASEFVYPTAFSNTTASTATTKITKPFINAVTDFGIMDVEFSTARCNVGRRGSRLSTVNGTLPLKRLGEYLRWLETSPEAVERYLSWWRCTKWGSQFESMLSVSYFPCPLCARSHRQHQHDGRAYSLNMEHVGPIFNTSSRPHYTIANGSLSF